VWHEHLSPLLSVKEAAGLRGVCKALKVLVMGWPMHLETLEEGELEEALTCFPATERFTMYYDEPLDPAEESRIMETLRGHGGTLKHVMLEADGKQLHSSAVRAGALPNLASIFLNLKDPDSRHILSEGVLRLLEEAEVYFFDPEHVAAVEPLRHLPHLRRLLLSCPDTVAAFPPCIPPSLKALTMGRSPGPTVGALLRDLLPMLQASGASLEELELHITWGDLGAKGAPSLAQVLRACSSTLKTLKLTDTGGASFGTACTRDLMPGLMSCCATLEVLHCPWAVFCALPATCPTFPRLTELSIQGGAGDKNVDLASPAWDIVAAGRLPALATLTIADETQLSLTQGQGGGAGGGRRARAWAAVAGTLKRLSIRCRPTGYLSAGACFEVGAAVGRLRRLRYLELDFIRDGRDYHALGQGLAASGGCPELVEIYLMALARNVEWLTYEPSLIVPSVRELSLWGSFTEEEALLLACGLVQMGYKHRFNSGLWGPCASPPSGPARACVKAILDCMSEDVRAGSL
jgi:hypothetical protein